MYPWITHTWNPLGGKCTHGCSYCSTNKFYYPNLVKKYSGEHILIDKEIKTNLGGNNFIFVCAQNDLFADGVDYKIISEILSYLEKFNNKYLLQTKNPKNLIGYLQLLPSDHFKQITPKISHGTSICTTIETNRVYPDVMNDCPTPKKRAEYFSLINNKMYEKYITIEPIMDFDLFEMVSLIRMCNPKQVNIGADSGNNNLPEPSKEKVLKLILELEKFTIVKQKNNLKRLL